MFDRLICSEPAAICLPDPVTDIRRGPSCMRVAIILYAVLLFVR
jgi:hypothetical protein